MKKTGPAHTDHPAAGLLAAGIVATYALAAKTMEIGTAVEGLTGIGPQERKESGFR